MNEGRIRDSAGKLVGYLVVLLLCTALLLLKSIVHPAAVIGDSMFPVLQNGDIVSTIPYDMEQEKLQIGDIVIFESGSSRKKLIKRVAGLGGDTIQIKDGVFYRNGKADDHPYPEIAEAGIAEEELTVPEGYVFCMGDNPNNSVDSRDFGCISENDVCSVVKKILIGNTGKEL